MTNFAGTLEESSRSRAGLWTRWFSRAADAMVRASRRRQAQRALSQLSDATLKDIGLRRCDIDSVAQAFAEGQPDPTRIRRSSRG